MISVYKLKSGFQKLLKPVLQALHKLGISANQITLAAIVLSLILGIVLYKAPFWKVGYPLLSIGLLLRMALNALDGMMASTYNQQSRLGEILNEMGDIISDLFIGIGLLFQPGLDPLLGALFLGLAGANEAAGILAKVISGKRAYHGPMGKSDRALLIGLVSLGYYFFPDLTSEYVNWIIGSSILLMLLSTSIRLSASLKNA